MCRGDWCIDTVEASVLVCPEAVSEHCSSFSALCSGFEHALTQQTICDEGIQLLQSECNPFMVLGVVTYLPLL